MTSFSEFYRHHFTSEHRHPANIALHIAGTIGGLAVLGAAAFWGKPWLLACWPIAHAFPGLVGHRLFERNAQVGDFRLTRRDFPLWWFIAANHRLALEVLFRRSPPGGGRDAEAR